MADLEALDRFPLLDDNWREAEDLDTQAMGEWSKIKEAYSDGFAELPDTVKFWQIIASQLAPNLHAVELDGKVCLFGADPIATRKSVQDALQEIQDGLDDMPAWRFDNALAQCPICSRWAYWNSNWETRSCQHLDGLFAGENPVEVILEDDAPEGIIQSSWLSQDLIELVHAVVGLLTEMLGYDPLSDDQEEIEEAAISDVDYETLFFGENATVPTWYEPISDWEDQSSLLLLGPAVTKVIRSAYGNHYTNDDCSGAGVGNAFSYSGLWSDGKSEARSQVHQTLNRWAKEAAACRHRLTRV